MISGFAEMDAKNVVECIYSGWWYTYPFKEISKSIGMMKFPTE